ncbi:hypothetical protein PAL_GLEAN10020714 [Pteropus alecto]|uniref:Uncharacterized protein n=1 Tax=Pteropus alecto TaxID=9402 RepID=L5JQR4_PTEAL|nr:hypothetical protein PAL_GLEAN10020714 [Pteropus alecto]
MTPKSSSSSSRGTVLPLDLEQSTHRLGRGMLKVDGLVGDPGYEKDTIKQHSAASLVTSYVVWQPAQVFTTAQSKEHSEQ